MALWIPTELGAALHAFWEGESGAGPTPNVDNSAVDAWVDQTVNAYTLAQATGGNQPTIQVNELNGLRTIRFDGTSDYLSITSNLGLTTQPYSIFGLWKPAVSAGAQVLLRKNNTPLIVHSAPASTDAFRVNSGTGVNTAMTEGAWHFTGAIHNGASSTVTIDGTTTSVSIGTNAFNGEAGALFVGRNTTADSWLNGDIAALLFIDGAVSSGDREKLEGWALWKYGLEANLPGGHPYEGAAPTVPDPPAAQTASSISLAAHGALDIKLPSGFFHLG